MRNRLSALIAIALMSASSVLAAQDTTTTPGVRLGLNYGSGVKPGVIVLPVVDDDVDSLRTIVQRDLDYSDRINVIDLDRETLSGLVPAPGQKLNFPLFAKFGAAVVVRRTPTTHGLPDSPYQGPHRPL